MITALFPIAFCLLIQSTVLLTLGLIALRLTRRRGPVVQSLIGRATLACVGLALLLAGPLTGRVRGVWHVALAEPTPRHVAAPPAPARRASAAGTTDGGGVREVVKFRPLNGGAAEGVAMDRAAMDRAAFLPAPSAKSLPDAHPTPPTTLTPSLPVSGGAATCRGVGSLWASGTALLLLWLAVCQRHLSRLRRQASPVTSGPAAGALAALTTRPPALLAHPSARSPFLAGLRRPAIFLSSTYETDFDPTALRAILAHELAHLARRDNAWTLAARLLTALLWPQPLLWVLCRRLEQIGEEACDLAVLAQDCPPHAYAECLLTLAERHPLGRRERALGAGVTPFRSSLGQRIGRILDKGTHAMSIVTTRLRLTVAALAVAATFGGAFLVSSAPAQVSAAPVLAPVQSGKSSPVGTWLCTHDDGTGTVMIFSAEGRFEGIGPWPGVSRAIGHSYGSNQAIGHSYGPYTTDGLELRYTDTRVWVEGEKPWKTNPHVHTMNYGIVGDVLTLQLKGKWVNVYHRVPAYTKSMLGINRRPSAPVPQGYVMQSYLGATPVGPARVISEAEIAARRDFMSGSIAAHPDPELSNARFLAGLTPVQGPGVVVTLNDSKKALSRKLPPGMTPPSIIHDSDINAVINELKAAGAEAIAVNGQRLVATSAVRCAGPTVFVNNMPQVPPFVIKAIGAPKALAAVMNLPGGIASQIKAFDPAMLSTREADTLTLPAYSGSVGMRYAKPASSALPEAIQQGVLGAEAQSLARQRRRL